MSVRIPESGELVPLLSALIGRDITFESGTDPLTPAEVEQHLTLFVSDDDEPLMLAGGDKPFAYLSGAALAMLPKGRAEDAIKDREPDEDLLENYFEVMNVLTRVINDQGGTHCRLIPQSSVVLSDLPEPAKGVGIDLDISNYGTGKLSFWLF